jgi:glycosidase
MTRLYREVMQFAEYLGKKKFLILGEIYHGDPHVIAPELAEHRVNAAFNYPAYFWDLPALLGNAPTRALEESFQFVSSGIGQGINRMVRFFENHDKPRFTGQPELLAVAHTYNMLSVGIPFIYYGSEQGFSRAQSNVNLGLDAYREDMFPGGEFRSAGSTGDDFNQKSPIYRHISALARARKSYPALSKGEQFIRWSDPNGPGIFAFSRIYENEEVVVVINTSNQPKTETWWVDASLNAHGEIYKDLLDREYKTAIHSPTDGRGSQMTVTIPPYGSRVLVVQKRP